MGPLKLRDFIRPFPYHQSRFWANQWTHDANLSYDLTNNFKNPQVLNYQCQQIPKATETSTHLRWQANVRIYHFIKLACTQYEYTYMY